MLRNWVVHALLGLHFGAISGLRAKRLPMSLLRCILGLFRAWGQNMLQMSLLRSILGPYSSLDGLQNVINIVVRSTRDLPQNLPLNHIVEL